MKPGEKAIKTHFFLFPLFLSYARIILRAALPISTALTLAVTFGKFVARDHEKKAGFP